MIILISSFVKVILEFDKLFSNIFFIIFFCSSFISTKKFSNFSISLILFDILFISLYNSSISNIFSKLVSSSFFNFSFNSINLSKSNPSNILIVRLLLYFSLK